MPLWGNPVLVTLWHPNTRPCTLAPTHRGIDMHSAEHTLKRFQSGLCNFVEARWETLHRSLEVWSAVVIRMSFVVWEQPLDPQLLVLACWSLCTDKGFTHKMGQTFKKKNTYKLPNALWVQQIYSVASRHVVTQLTEWASFLKKTMKNRSH